MDGIWRPDLSQIGLDSSALPEGWGWTTLNKKEAWEAGEPLPREPRYGEFVVAPYVTDSKACNKTFECTRLVVANVAGDHRNEWWFSPSDREWRKSLIPWADAPHWWLFGPQGQEFLRLAEDCAGVSVDLWRQLDAFSSIHSIAAAHLRRGPEPEVLNEVDHLMSNARRKGAVTRALHRAGELFYGHRVSQYDQYRFVTSEGLAGCRGTALYGVDRYVREEVGAMDNAIRWLILRDILPPATYRMVAEPWQAVFKRPLHPEDAF